MIEVIVEAEDWFTLLACDEARLEQLVARAAATVLEEPLFASLLLADDATLQALNKQFRNIDKPTNVLSFEDDSPGDYCGDIAIAWQTVAREAAEEGKPVADHLCHMIIHGCLHLLGEDHQTDKEAEQMERLEVAALAQLGIPDPYAWASDAAAKATTTEAA